MNNPYEPREGHMNEQDIEKREEDRESRAVYLRHVALEQAAKWASGEGWSGTSVQVVACAQIFEHYLVTGEQPDAALAVEILNKARETSVEIRRS